jgi:NTP pyrophosphatase (non-canonical NTP hydrolase)
VADLTTCNGDSIADIQRINVDRANRWHAGDFHQWSVLEWAGAMCGEAGEAANVAKKLRRYELELEGNQFSDNRPMGGIEGLRAQLAHECADTFLYLALLAARYDIDLAIAVRDRFNAKSEEMGFPERLS